jgi:hypothetical protein
MHRPDVFKLVGAVHVLLTLVGVLAAARSIPRHRLAAECCVRRQLFLAANWRRTKNGASSRGASTRRPEYPWRCFFGCLTGAMPLEVYNGRKKALVSVDARKLVAQAHAGIPKADLARAYGISRETVYQYLRQN